MLHRVPCAVYYIATKNSACPRIVLYWALLGAVCQKYSPKQCFNGKIHQQHSMGEECQRVLLISGIP